MAEITWVKLSTELFDNSKINYIRTMPEGNNILLIWIFLLTMAGKCNSDGLIFLTEDIPMSDEILSDLSGFEVNVVRMALSVFDRLGMIQWSGANNEYIGISGWEKYQSVDKLQDIRKKNAKRQKEYRMRQNDAAKGLPDNSNVTVTSPVTSPVTLRNVTVTEQKKNKEKELDTEENKDIPPISPVEMMGNILKEYSFGNILSEKLIEWVRYKDSRNESCQEYTIKCLLRRVDEELKLHDEGVIIQLIDNSILNGWKNIQWKDLKANSSGTSGSYIEAINTRVSAVDDW